MGDSAGPQALKNRRCGLVQKSLGVAVDLAYEIILKREATFAGLGYHPSKREIRQSVFSVTAADIAVNAPKPHLHNVLAFLPIGLKGRGKRVAAFINGDGMTRVFDGCAKAGGGETIACA